MQIPIKDESERETIVSADKLYPLEVPCFHCGENINLLRKHFTLCLNEEVVEENEDEVCPTIKESELLGYFCSRECFIYHRIRTNVKQTLKT